MATHAHALTVQAHAVASRQRLVQELGAQAAQVAWRVKDRHPMCLLH